MAGELNLCCGTSHHHVEFSGILGPAMLFHVVVGKCSAAKRNGNRARFARLQEDLHESLQFLYWPGNAGVRLANVNFRNLSPGPAPSVGHFETNRDSLVRGRTQFQILISK